jgi:succinyl-diaminopimelate desuccinylase
VDFGLVNETIHAIDERTQVADLETLTRIYQHFLDQA